MKTIRKVVFCLFIFSFFGGFVFADSLSLDIRVDECRNIFEEIMQMPDRSIPTDLLARCSGVAIFPSVVKGGFIFGGKFGRGVVLYRNKKTGFWSAPSFTTIAGGSWGLQVGGQLVDLILVIMNDRGMKGLVQDRFTVGGDIGVSAGPVGRNAEAGTDLLLKAEILSYSRSKGLFAGVSLKGSVIMPDKEANKEFYGQELTSEQILFGTKVRPSRNARDLVDALRRYSR